MQTIFGSHSAIPPFHLMRPRRPAEAAAMQSDAGADAWFMAGGIDLIPAMRAGRKTTALISLSGVETLSGIERHDDRLRIGAACTYGTIAANPIVAATIPDLAAALGGVANVRVRHAASIGGNIMARQANYDALTALTALGAALIFVEPNGQRHKVLAGSSTFPSGLLEAVEIPLAAARRFTIDRSYKPVVSVALSVTFANDALIARAAIGCAYALPIAVSLDLAGIRDASTLAAQAGQVTAAAVARLPTPTNDLAGSAGYRQTLIGVLLRRALVALAERQTA